MNSLRSLYPPLMPYKEQFLKVSELHSVYVRESGNPSGIAVLFNHGGPGGGISGSHARQFDPSFFRIVQFDQRGAGRSTPHADIRENTTENLIEDIELIRKLLGIEQWIVAGRSWGTTLSLLYAQRYPQYVRALYLAAVFLCDDQSIRWLFQDGAGHVYSEAWNEFCALVPMPQRGNMMKAYAELLFGTDAELGARAASAWSKWESITCSVLPDEDLIQTFTEPHHALSLARFECHYLMNRGFIEQGQILRDAHRIADIPCKIIHGRYDMNCTHDNAKRLHTTLPKSELITVQLGGHAANDPETIDRQVRAADSLKSGGSVTQTAP